MIGKINWSFSLKIQRFNYPTLKISDPYRWLEDPDAKETQEFVKKLNQISGPFISASPVREKLRENLNKLWDYEKFGCTGEYYWGFTGDKYILGIRGDYFYYYHNSGLQNQSVIYQQKSLEEKGAIFLDPNTLSEVCFYWRYENKIILFGTAPLH